jgi:hypothetical protein
MHSELARLGFWAAALDAAEETAPASSRPI